MGGDTPDVRGEHVTSWVGRLGIVLAVAGSAVGLGNFLRFPSQAAKHGGGAFMIPYVVAFLVLGLPIAWAEWAMGRHAGVRGSHSLPAILATVTGRPRMGYLGVLGVLVPLSVFTYYVLIEAWCLRYATLYLTGGPSLGDDLGGAAKQTFVAISGSVGGIDRTQLVFWAVAIGLNGWIVARGFDRGIQALSRWAMPLMAVLALVVLARVLTLGTPDPTQPERSVLGGLGFLWNPSFSALTRFDTWLAAAGQVFFSLSVGFGVIAHYASHLRRDDDVVLSSLTASATNELFEVVFGGLITVTAAFVFLGAAAMDAGSFGLGFLALPVVFHQLGPTGSLVGLLWFALLFLAALTSSLSMLQPVSAFVAESLELSERRAAGIVLAVATAGSGWVMFHSHDLAALEALDFWVGTVGVFLFAAIQVVIFSWVWGAERGLAEANHGARLPLPGWWAWVLRYVSPGFLLVVLVGFCVQELPKHLAVLADSVVMTRTLGLVGIAALAVAWLVRRRQAVRLRGATT